MAVKRGMLIALVIITWVLGAAFFVGKLAATATVSGQEISAYSFPFSVPGTPLLALELCCYDGIYLEDGSRERVEGIAACILQNSGNAIVENALVELWQDQRCYLFRLDYLPPGERVLVLDANREKLQTGEITNALGSYTTAAKDIPGLVTLRETQRRFLLITNPGPIPLKNLTVYFKNYDPDKRLFLGGIAYEISIAHIAPGETFFAEPYYYESGKSRIVKIKTSG